MHRLGRYVLILSLGLVLLMAPAGWAGMMQDRYELLEGAWRLEASPEADTPAGRLQAARRALADDQPGEAERLIDEWLKEHETNHDLVPEARMIRGDALVARGREYDALFDYEYVIRVYPDSPQFHQALEREYEIARLFTTGTRRHLWGMRILPAYSEGEELLIRIQERAPGSVIGEQASLMLADYYYRRGEMASAAEAYDLFLLNYPQSDRRERAMQRLIQANLARVRGPGFDPTGLLEAGERMRMYQEEFPRGAEQMGDRALELRIEESLAAKDLRSARWYERRGERVSAAYLYERLIADYPQTVAAGEARDLLEAMNMPVRPGLSARGRQDEDNVEQEDVK